MKNTVTFLFSIILFGLLVSCQHATDAPVSNHDNNPDTDLTAKETIEQPNFIGIIEEIHGDSELVKVEEGEILKSGQHVGGIDLSLAEDTAFEVGDSVKVKFEGGVRESYPLGINTVSVEKLE